MSTRTRPLRNLAAWGYESTSTGTRVEIDVWTVNAGERDEEEEPDPYADREDITLLDRRGNIAYVRYENLGTDGYRRIEPDERASQQAWAGAVRSAGGSRTPAGTFSEGWSSPVGAPTLRECVEHGNQEILPAVRAAMREIGTAITREPPSDEVDEPVETAPFEGFRNVIRVFPGTGKQVYRYRVGNATGTPAGDGSGGIESVSQNAPPIGRST